MNVDQVLANARHAEKQGNFSEAERFYLHLLGAGFQVEAILNALVNVSFLSRSFDRAAHYLAELNLQFPKKIAYCDALANLHVRAQNPVAAADCYAKFILHNPSHADAYFNHAYHLKQAGKYQQAIDNYRLALSYSVRQPEEALTNIAVIYSENLRQESKAIQSLELALEACPDYLPALFNLATIYEEENDKERAAKYYQLILDIEPNHHLALMRLADTETVLNEDAEIIAQVRSALRADSLDKSTQISLNFSLAKLLDDCGNYDQAFERYSLANRLSREENPAYNAKAQSQKIIENIGFFTEQWFQNLAPYSDASPIFICGMFRSGSTLLEQILAAHNDLTAGGERDYFLRIDGTRIKNYPRGLEELSASNLKSIANDYLADLARAFPEAKFISDKRPENFLYLGLIKTLFPNAKIIHTQRNALDNCLSIYFLRSASSVSYAHDLDDIVHYYQQYQTLMAHWNSIFAGEIYSVNYDDLVASAENQIRGVLNYLDLPWDPNCLDFHRIKNRVKTASLWQIRQPLYNKSSGRWKHYEKNIPSLIEAFS